jgi:uncharacterized protein (TIGR02246 family)
MRISSRFLIGALAVIFAGVVLVGCGGAAPGENKATADEVTAMWTNAFNSGNAATLAALYAENAHSTAPSGGPSRGRKDIEVYWRADMKPGETTALKATDSIAQGNLLHVSGTYEVAAKGAKVAYGQFEQLWARDNGAWKVTSEIWSLDPMAQRDPDAANRLESAWTTAYNAGDAAKLAALYDKDAVLSTRPSGSVEGKDAIEFFWKNDFGGGKPTTKLEMTDAYMAGDLAHLEGEYEVTDKGKISKGHYVQLWMQDGDDWRIHREMWWQ